MTTTALVCGFLAYALASGASGVNLVQDPSFELGPPRGLDPHDRPWGGEEEGSPAGVEIMQGSAADGTQFARMQYVSGTGSECPGCNQSFLFQRIDVTPYTDYTFSYWIRGTTLVTSGIQIPFLDDCTKYPPPPSDPTRANLCPDNDGDEEVDLGPTPPNYDKEFVAYYDSETPTSNTNWSLISHAFNSGPHSVLYVRWYNVYYGTDHTDIDNVSVVARGASSATPTPPSSGTPCDLLTSSVAVPTNFGAAWNVLSQTGALLMKTFCPSAASVSASVDYQIGNGSSWQYIYNQGYYWGGSSWIPYTYNCSNLISGLWCVGNASYTRTNVDTTQKQSYLAYICNWEGSSWHCGCHDSACATNYWNLQQFRK